MIDTLIKSIVEFFKPSIHKIITKNWNKGAKNLHINLYLKDQILFQVIPSRYFKERGIKSLNELDMSIIHFFNKNKTITFDKLEKFKSRISKNGYIEFETKTNFNFVRNVGSNPRLIEKDIYKDIGLYGLMEFEKHKIKLEFIDFKEGKNKASIQHGV